MTLSLWRYSHLLLAVISSLFLLMASVTGIILAIEPITHQSKGYAPHNLNEISLSETIEAVKAEYEEVFSLEVESSGFVKASVLNEDFDVLDIYINPKTGEQLGAVTKRPEIYNFATNLHRSLFLKSTGRFLVGLASLLLLIITITGLVLVVKRQGGISKIFSKVRKEYFEMRYHVILSRWLFIPIFILSLTGVYLSAERFELLPETNITLVEKPETADAIAYESLSEIPFFKDTSLSQVQKMDFPFSDDADDYFHINLKDREIEVNQQTGEIVAEAPYPIVKLASQISFILHTGEGSVWWSIVLLITSASLIFFMYSGFAMTIKRRRKLAVSKRDSLPTKEESEYIILVGSESGNTFDYAQRFFHSLLDQGKKAYITELNKYDEFPSAKHLIVMTATYGEGEPPTNAWRFMDVFETVQQKQNIGYSIVGFGSLEYPDYCAFAIEVDELLRNTKGFQEELPIFKINDGNFTAFEKWVNNWSEHHQLNLKIEAPKAKKKKLQQWDFEVLERTEINSDYTFLLRLRPKKNLKFNSGDLLSVVPEGSDIPRQYSIAKIGNDILLSIKRHEFGKASNYLYSLKKGDILTGAMETNPEFHFPKKSKSAILIANGTGIAPFLGMVQDQKEAPINLLWGTRTYSSCHLYDEVLGKNQCVFSENRKKNLNVHRCFSREEVCQRYVQDLVKEQADLIVENFENNGVCMICGSLSMQNDVLDEIDRILQEKSNTSLDVVMQKGLLKMDCY